MPNASCLLGKNMAYKIKFYFGENVRVVPLPAAPKWLTRTYPGGNGESAINMGRPGSIIQISGTFREKATTYSDGVFDVYRNCINPLFEKFQEANDWEYDRLIFKQCIMINFKPLPMRKTGSDILCPFTATIKQLKID